jgi:hypothetical protein
VQVVEHEAHVTQRQGVDCLPAAGDAVRRTQLVVQIDRAEASCNLERSPAPAGQGKRVGRNDASVGRS